MLVPRHPGSVGARVVTQRTTTSKRAYKSPRRLEQAAQTRTAVLEAAVRLFGERGWATTGMRDVAAEAGVSVETVYSNFKSKVDLLMAAIDVQVVGDAQPVALADRSEFTQMAAGSHAERVTAAAHLLTQVNQRTAGLHEAVRQGAASEPELAARLAEGERRRRVNIVQAAELITGRTIPDRDADTLWAVLSVEVFGLLTGVMGWSVPEYTEWAAREIASRLAAIQE